MTCLCHMAKTFTQDLPLVFTPPAMQETEMRLTPSSFLAN